MENFRVTATGAPEEVEELEQHFRKCGLLTEHGLVSSYEGVAVTVFALHAVGRMEAVAQCLAEYGEARKGRLKVTYFAPGKGQQTVKDYAYASILAVLKETQELNFARVVEVKGEPRSGFFGLWKKSDS